MKAVISTKYQDSSIKYQESGFRFQDSSIKYQESGIKYQESGFRFQVFFSKVLFLMLLIIVGFAARADVPPKITRPDTVTAATTNTTMVANGGSPVEMATGMRSSGKIYVVVAVLSTAGKFADASLFDAMAQELVKIEDSGDRQKILSTMARVREPALRERALALALNEKVNGRETQNFLYEALDQDHNRTASFAFVRKNFDTLTAKVPPHRVAQFMLGLERMCSSDERASFVDFFSTRNSMYEGGPLIYTQSLEKIDLCIAARANNMSIKQAGVK